MYIWIYTYMYTCKISRKPSGSPESPPDYQKTPYSLNKYIYIYIRITGKPPGLSGNTFFPIYVDVHPDRSIHEDIWKWIRSKHMCYIKGKHKHQHGCRTALPLTCMLLDTHVNIIIMATPHSFQGPDRKRYCGQMESVGLDDQFWNMYSCDRNMIKLQLHKWMEQLVPIATQCFHVVRPDVIGPPKVSPSTSASWKHSLLSHSKHFLPMFTAGMDKPIPAVPAGLNRSRNLTEAPKQIDNNLHAKRKTPAPLITATHTHILGLTTFEHHTVGPGAVCEARGEGGGWRQLQWASARHRGAPRGGPGGLMALGWFG